MFDGAMAAALAAQDWWTRLSSGRPVPTLVLGERIQASVAKQAPLSKSICQRWAWTFSVGYTTGLHVSTVLG